MYARLSETYDAAESVPTQLERADADAERSGWAVAARFKDDGYSGFTEIIRDIDRLVRARAGLSVSHACRARSTRLSRLMAGGNSSIPC